MEELGTATGPAGDSARVVDGLVSLVGLVGLRGVGCVAGLRGCVAGLPGCVTRLPGCVTRLPGCVTRLPGCVTRLPGCVTRLPGCVARLPGDMADLTSGLTGLPSSRRGMAGCLAGGVSGLSGLSCGMTTRVGGRHGLRRLGCLRGLSSLYRLRGLRDLSSLRRLGRRVRGLCRLSRRLRSGLRSLRRGLRGTGRRSAARTRARACRTSRPRSDRPSKPRSPERHQRGGADRHPRDRPQSHQTAFQPVGPIPGDGRGLDIGQELGDVRVPLPGILRQRPHQKRPHRHRDRADRHRRRLVHRAQTGHRVGPERPPAGHALVEGHRRRVHVRGRRCRPAVPLLGRHVRRRPLGRGALAGRGRDAEVREFATSGGIDQHVLRLVVAVHHSPSVRRRPSSDPRSMASADSGPMSPPGDQRPRGNAFDGSMTSAVPPVRRDDQLMNPHHVRIDDPGHQHGLPPDPVHGTPDPRSVGRPGTSPRPAPRRPPTEPAPRARWRPVPAP